MNKPVKLMNKAELQNYITELQNEVKSANAERDDAVEALSTLDNTLKVKGELAYLTQRIDTLMVSETDLENQLAESKETIESLETKIDDHKETIEDLEKFDIRVLTVSDIVQYTTGDEKITLGEINELANGVQLFKNIDYK